MDWEKWAAIGQLIGAAASFAAVVTSLYLARRAEKPKLRVGAGRRVIIGTGPFPDVIEISVRNTGSLTAHVNQFGWRTGRWPFKWPGWAIRQFAVQIPGELGIGQNTPFEVPPGQKRTMILNEPNFLASLSEMSGPVLRTQVAIIRSETNANLGGRPSRERPVNLPAY